MTAVQEAIKEQIQQEMADLPAVLTVKDIYDYFGGEMGMNKVYEIVQQMDYRKFGKKYYIPKCSFMNFLYKEGENEKN